MTNACLCPCCGYPDLDRPAYAAMPATLDPLPLPPYGAHWGAPSYEVCDCCGFEFGNEDDPGTAAPITFSDYLADWIADGERWFAPGKRPPGWSLAGQLRDAGRGANAPRARS